MAEAPVPAPAVLGYPKRFGAYELLGPLGKGAMGMVYKARWVPRGAIVALKVLPPRYGKDSVYVKRFEREVQAMGALNHPHIVRGLDAGQLEGLLYYTMEFVEGETLERRLRREKKIPEAEVLRIVTCVAKALEHAAEQGIIHRDVKPSNILLTERGEVKLADFGLARPEGESHLTQTGTALGTPYYISPEQARGEKDLDARSDLYSLGATAFHLLCGGPPFEGTTAPAIMEKHVHEAPPDVRKTNPAVSEPLARIVRKLLSKNRDDRYPSAGILAEDLALVRDGKEPANLKARVAGARPAGNAKGQKAASRRAEDGALEPDPKSEIRNPKFIWGSVAAGLLLGAGLLWYLSRPGATPPPPPSPVAVAPANPEPEKKDPPPETVKPEKPPVKETPRNPVPNPPVPADDPEGKGALALEDAREKAAEKGADLEAAATIFEAMALAHPGTQAAAEGRAEAAKLLAAFQAEQAQREESKRRAAEAALFLQTVDDKIKARNFEGALLDAGQVQGTAGLPADLAARISGLTKEVEEKAEVSFREDEAQAAQLLLEGSPEEALKLLNLWRPVAIEAVKVSLQNSLDAAEKKYFDKTWDRAWLGAAQRDYGAVARELDEEASKAAAFSTAVRERLSRRREEVLAVGELWERARTALKSQVTKSIKARGVRRVFLGFDEKDPNLLKMEMNAKVPLWDLILPDLEELLGDRLLSGSELKRRLGFSSIFDGHLDAARDLFEKLDDAEKAKEPVRTYLAGIPARVPDVAPPPVGPGPDPVLPQGPRPQPAARPTYAETLLKLTFDEKEPTERTHAAPQTAKTETAEGYLGRGLAFPDEDSVLLLPREGHFDPDQGTFLAWVKPLEGSGKGGENYTLANVGRGENRWLLRISPVAQFGFSPKRGEQTHDIRMEEPWDGKGAWRHVALTWEGTGEGKARIRLYIDGRRRTVEYRQKGEKGMEVQIPYPDAGKLKKNLFLGGYGNDLKDVTDGLRGILDEVQIVGRVLTDGEVRDHVAREKTLREGGTGSAPIAVKDPPGPADPPAPKDPSNGGGGTAPATLARISFDGKAGADRIPGGKLDVRGKARETEGYIGKGIEVSSTGSGVLLPRPGEALTEGGSLLLWIKKEKETDRNDNLSIATMGAIGKAIWHLEFSRSAITLEVQVDAKGDKGQKRWVNMGSDKGWKDEWHHVAVTWRREGEEMAYRFYADGERISSKEGASEIRLPGNRLILGPDIRLGGAGPNLDRSLMGVLDEVHVMERPLSDQEVRSHVKRERDIHEGKTPAQARDPGAEPKEGPAPEVEDSADVKIPEPAKEGSAFEYVFNGKDTEGLEVIVEPKGLKVGVRDGRLRIEEPGIVQILHPRKADGFELSAWVELQTEPKYFGVFLDYHDDPKDPKVKSYIFGGLTNGTIVLAEPGQGGVFPGTKAKWDGPIPGPFEIKVRYEKEEISFSVGGKAPVRVKKRLGDGPVGLRIDQGKVDIKALKIRFFP